MSVVEVSVESLAEQNDVLKTEVAELKGKLDAMEGKLDEVLALLKAKPVVVPPPAPQVVVVHSRDGSGASVHSHGDRDHCKMETSSGALCKKPAGSDGYCGTHRALNKEGRVNCDGKNKAGNQCRMAGKYEANEDGEIKHYCKTHLPVDWVGFLYKQKNILGFLPTLIFDIFNMSSINAWHRSENIKFSMWSIYICWQLCPITTVWLFNHET